MQGLGFQLTISVSMSLPALNMLTHSLIKVASLFWFSFPPAFFSIHSKASSLENMAKRSESR